MHDVVIRGGKIVDGTGKPAFIGDVAIAKGRVAAVGKDLGNARKIRLVATCKINNLDRNPMVLRRLLNGGVPLIFRS